MVIIASLLRHACIFSAIILIVMAWLSSFIKPSLYMFIALIIADMELIIKGPVISINHSVSDSEKKYYHRCLIGILAVFNIIIIAATVLHLYRTASCISIVIIFCFISHIACMNRKSNRKSVLLIHTYSFLFSISVSIIDIVNSFFHQTVQCSFHDIY
ncbi:MAG: accessory gene regulator B family protein [Lachnospira eligens]